MNAIARGVKATYNFFAGDAIILTAVIIAFVVGAVLARAAKAPNLVSAVVFIALIAGGLVATLNRERAGRPKAR
jgi:hypothetical protein